MEEDESGVQWMVDLKVIIKEIGGIVRVLMVTKIMDEWGLRRGRKEIGRSCGRERELHKLKGFGFRQEVLDVKIIVLSKVQFFEILVNRLKNGF